MKKVILSMFVFALVFSTAGIALAKEGNDNPGKGKGLMQRIEERLFHRSEVSVDVQKCQNTFRTTQDTYVKAKRTAQDTYLAAMKTARDNYLVALKTAKESNSKDAAKLARRNYSTAKKAAKDAFNAAKKSADATFKIAKDIRRACVKAAKPSPTPEVEN